MLNHRPEDQGIWIDFNGWRYKDVYHVKLKAGTVYKNCRPNGDAFIHGDRIIPDDQVVQVMLALDEELGKWNFKGKSRIRRNLEMFGDAVPPKFTMDADGHSRARSWMEENGLIHLLDKEQSVDGYTLVALANKRYQDILIT